MTVIVSSDANPLQKVAVDRYAYEMGRAGYQSMMRP